MAGVFLNYRRDDSPGHAGRLYDRLRKRFGHARVFMDLDIEPGVDFEQAIRRHVGLCDAFIVLIGRDWLTIADRTGRPRLQDPLDWTRLEIEIALERDIPVIPVLVHGARMPTPDELPAPLRKLATRNALELSDNRWEYDAGRLLQILAKSLQADAESAESDTGPYEGEAENAFHTGNRHRSAATSGTHPKRGLRGIDWPEFTMSAAIVFTWFWGVRFWVNEAGGNASEGVARILAISSPALICGYGTAFGVLLPAFKAIAGLPKVVLAWVPLVGAVFFASLVGGAELLQPDSEGRFGVVTASAFALAFCNLGPVLAAHLRAEKWSWSQVAVRTLVASAAFTLGTRIARFRPEAPILGDLLYSGVALAPLVCAAFAGISAWRTRQMGDFSRSWMVVPLISGALLLGYGGVRGKVIDTTEAVLPGVTVEYGQCTSYTDDHGVFAVENLCLPIYRQLFAPADVRVSLPGFTTAHISTVTVPGVNRYLNVPLKVGNVAESVELSSSAFSFVTLVALPLSSLSIALPLMWMWRRKRSPHHLIAAERI